MRDLDGPDAPSMADGRQAGARIRRRSRRAVAVGAAVAAGLLLAACGGGEDSENANATGGDKPSSMTFLVAQFAKDFDVDGVPNLTQAQVNANAYAGLLVYPTSEQDGVLMPDYSDFEGNLAESWTQKGKSWTFTLRQGVKGCTGNEMTADDVVYTFQRAKSQSGESNQTYGQYVSARLFDPEDTSKTLDAEVEKIDDYTVKFTTVAPSASWPQILADRAFGLIYDSALMKENATPGDKWSHKWLGNGHTAGFGPYCVDSVNEDSQEIRLRANEGWWGEKPQFTNVVMRAVPDASSRAEAVRAGAADGTNGLSPAAFENLSNAVSVYSVEGSQVIWLNLNYKFEPWGAERSALVRKAVQAALPYESILSGPLSGAGAPLAAIAPPVYAGTAEFEPPTQDLERAKELLAEAGFPNGEGIGGRGLTLHWNNDSHGSIAPQIANQIRTALADIGINIQLEPLTGETFLPQVVVEKTAPMAIWVLNPGNTPSAVAAAQQFFDSTSFPNASNYRSDEFDEAIRAAVAGAGSAEGDEAAQRAQDILWEDLPVVPIAQVKSQLALKKGISGWAVGPITDVPTFWTFKSE